MPRICLRVSDSDICHITVSQLIPFCQNCQRKLHLKYLPEKTYADRITFTWGFGVISYFTGSLFALISFRLAMLVFFFCFCFFSQAFSENKQKIPYSFFQMHTSVVFYRRDTWRFKEKNNLLWCYSDPPADMKNLPELQNPKWTFLV